MTQFLQLSNDATVRLQHCMWNGNTIDGCDGDDDDNVSASLADDADVESDAEQPSYPRHHSHHQPPHHHHPRHTRDDDLTLSSRLVMLLQQTVGLRRQERSTGGRRRRRHSYLSASYDARQLSQWRQQHYYHQHQHHQHPHHHHQHHHHQRHQHQHQHDAKGLFCVANFNWLAKAFQSLLRTTQITPLQPAAGPVTAATQTQSPTPTSTPAATMDSHSMLYLLLVIFVYCCVLMRAASALEQAPASSTPPPAPPPPPPAAATASSSQSLMASVILQLPRGLTANATTSDGGDGGDDSDDVLEALRDGGELQHLLHKRDAAAEPNSPDDEEDSSYNDDEFDEYEALINNKSAKGKYIGAPCSEMKCEPTLLHVTCDKETLTCGCARNYPVKLGLTKGCDKPKKLGEQCFYDETCMYSDENSLCVQVRHNAMCQCANGFHSVSYSKPTRRVFCTQDLGELNSDLPTLLGVTTGIAVLAGLICMVLHLFSKTKYPRHRNFGDANLPPPIMYSSDTGIPLTVQSGRPSSRSSLRSSGSIGSYGNRRSSSGGGLAGHGGPGAAAAAGHAGGAGGMATAAGAGSKGILVSTSRTGSRRPSLASVHSTSSSVRSYSMMRFEKEAQQKEIRQEMKLRLARLQQQQHLNQNKPQIIIGDTLPSTSSTTSAAGTPLTHALSHHPAATPQTPASHHHSQQLPHHMPHHVGGGGGGGVGVLSRITMTSTPSPLTPNSTDELLPSVDELQEYPPPPEAHKQLPMDLSAAALRHSVTTSGVATVAAGAAYIGPCSSSTEAL